MISFFEYPKFFGTVARKFVETPGFYEYFMKYNFNPSQWPECDGKATATKFDSMAREKSIEHAKLELRNKINHLADVEFPDSSKEIIAQFEEFKTFGIWSQVGEKIVQNPFLAQQVLADVNSKISAGLSALLVQEHLAPYAEAHIKKMKAGVSSVTEIRNWPILSASVGGFNPGRIFLFVAGTGVGKTTLMLNLTLDALKTMPVLFINMEMSKEDVFDRIIQIGSGITSDQWNNKISEESDNKLGSFLGKIYSNNPFLLTDGRALTIDQIKSLIFSYKESHGISLVVLDYDQKIRTSHRGEEWQAIQKAIEDLEEVAKITKTAIIVLAQGDDNNDPKASKRSAQPASAVLSMHLDPDTNKYLITSKKNRFGPKFNLEIDCDFSIYKVKEKQLHHNMVAAPKVVNRGMR